MKTTFSQMLDMQKQAVRLADAIITPMMGPFSDQFHDALGRHGLAAANPFWMFLSNGRH